jgi:hypothetical protein
MHQMSKRVRVSYGTAWKYVQRCKQDPPPPDLTADGGVRKGKMSHIPTILP